MRFTTFSASSSRSPRPRTPPSSSAIGARWIVRPTGLGTATSFRRWAPRAPLSWHGMTPSSTCAHRLAPRLQSRQPAAPRVDRGSGGDRRADRRGMVRPPAPTGRGADGGLPPQGRKSTLTPERRGPGMLPSPRSTVLLGRRSERGARALTSRVSRSVHRRAFAHASAVDERIAGMENHASAFGEP